MAQIVKQLVDLWQQIPNFDGQIIETLVVNTYLKAIVFLADKQSQSTGGQLELADKTIGQVSLNLSF